MTKTTAPVLRLAHVPGGQRVCEAHNNLHAVADDFHYDDGEHECMFYDDDFTDCANIG
jgi:hypothetical protein